MGTLKIEAGKTYRTRDGELVRILATDVKDKHYPVTGALRSEDGKREAVDGWTADGSFLHNDTHDLDLVAEYREPRTFTLVFHETLGLETWYGGDRRDQPLRPGAQAILVREVIDGDR